MNAGPVLLAGGTGDLGGRIAKALLARGATVRAVLRPGTAADKVVALRHLGAEVALVNFDDAAALAESCAGAGCVVSALSGLRGTILQSQGALLDAAVRAGVPRFIPSDFGMDLFKIPPGRNRNFDLRREFHARLTRAPIAATSILSGAFADMLGGEAPLILFGLRRVLYWSNPDQPLDFTTKDNVAEFTAAAALDPTTPPVLRIAGDVASARQLATIAAEVTGMPFGLLPAGGLGLLRGMIAVTRKLMPRDGEVFPPWQGMQYVENMFDGRGKLESLDNDRYPEIRWTGLREVLASRA
ncbi:NmrA family NAD(P)-binding protein [Roseomonas sp. WA12]